MEQLFVDSEVENSRRLEPAYVLFSRRQQRDGEFFEYYRCFAHHHQVVLSARALRIGKPLRIYEGPDSGDPVIEVKNARNYLFNGRTEFCELPTGKVLGSYTRLNAVLDEQENKLGRWHDARSWSEEFRENLVDALANAVLGGGDGTAGINSSDTHLLSQGKSIFASLQRQRMEFFPDPPKSESPGRLAKLAGRLIPGELGRSIRENLPPFGWSLHLSGNLPAQLSPRFILCSAILRIEMLRYSRSA